MQGAKQPAARGKGQRQADTDESERLGQSSPHGEAGDHDDVGRCKTGTTAPQGTCLRFTPSPTHRSQSSGAVSTRVAHRIALIAPYFCIVYAAISAALARLRLIRNNPMQLIDVGEHVRDARQARGWSQRQLAEASGVSRARIGRLENGQLGDIGYRLLQLILLPLALDLRITDYNGGHPTLEQLSEESEREMARHKWRGARKPGHARVRLRICGERASGASKGAGFHPFVRQIAHRQHKNTRRRTLIRMHGPRLRLTRRQRTGKPATSLGMRPVVRKRAGFAHRLP